MTLDFVPQFSLITAVLFILSGLGSIAIAYFALRSESVLHLIRSHVFLQPNAWSILRIFLGLSAPWLVFLGIETWLLAVILGFAMATDAIDGMIARACGLVSASGKWLDPLADKIVYLPLFVWLVFSGRIDGTGWVWLVLVSDIIGTVGRPWLVSAATIWGKIKTCLAFVLLAWYVSVSSTPLVSSLTLAETLAGWVLAVLAILSVISKIPSLHAKS